MKNNSLTRPRCSKVLGTRTALRVALAPGRDIPDMPIQAAGPERAMNRDAGADYLLSNLIYPLCLRVHFIRFV